MTGRYHLGVDVGGTFTDLLLMERGGEGALYALKTPSTAAPHEAILAGIRGLEERYGVGPGDISHFVQGTTLGVNTLLEGTGAKGGLLTTEGFRDLLELRRLRLDHPNNLMAPRPVPLIPRRRVREVRERLAHDGRVLRPIEQNDVLVQAAALVEEGIETIAICFLHAHTDNSHERLAKDWIEEQHPDLYVCTSAELWPQQREYERGLVSVMNGYIAGRMRRYFEQLERDVRRAGMTCRIFSTKSNGGVMSTNAAAKRPVETLLSGPASGVIGAAYIGRLIGEDRLITLDMGGTSVDVAVIDREVTTSTENTIGEYPVIMPAVDVSAIGAGGGSIAWVDPEGLLKVGPKSAGAVPGPACYGRGGKDATVTDAYLTTGILTSGGFLGGEMPLDPALAEQALGRLGERVGLGPVETADAILRVASATILANLTPQIARRGVEGSDFSLLAYGAAGPTQVFMLARDLKVRRVIVPPTPGTLCALGCLVADLRADFVKSVWADCASLAKDALRTTYTELEQAGRAWLEAEAVDLEQVHLLRSADLCYAGQSYQLTVTFPEVDRAALRPEAVADWFHEHYARVYGYADRGAPVRMLEARVQIVGTTQKPAIRRLVRRSGTTGPAVSARPVFEGGAWRELRVVDRGTLRAGDTLEAPLIVEQYDTTVYVPEGFRITVDDHGNLIGERLT